MFFVCGLKSVAKKQKMWYYYIYVKGDLMKSIYEYLNYREFLGDYYNHKKLTAKKFSHRIWASAAGFSASNFIKNVIDGKKDLGTKSIPKMIKACGMKKREGEYFTLLVGFAKAKSDSIKNSYFRKISEIRNKRKVESLSEKQYRFYSKWYYPVVREIIVGKKVGVDFSKLAKLVLPEITYHAFANAVNELLKIELISIKNGIYHQSSNLIRKDEGVVSLAVRNYNDEMLDHAKRVIRELPVEERSVSSVTLKFNKDKYSLLANRIAEFRQELLQIAAGDSESDTVYHASFQLFPLSGRDQNA